MWLIIYLSIGAVILVLSARFGGDFLFDPEDVKFFRDEPLMGAGLLFLTLLVWPFFAIGEMLRRLIVLSFRKRESDDDDPRE